MSDQVLGTRREDLVPPFRASRVSGDSPGWRDRHQNRNLYGRGWDMITSSGADQVMELLNNEEG